MKIILFRFASVLISLVAVAVVSEVAMRIFEPHGGIIRRFDHELGWVPLENVSQPGVHQNQFGLRGPDDMRIRGHREESEFLCSGIHTFGA